MSWRVVVGIFLLSLALRLAYVIVCPSGPLETDAIDYDTIGWNLVQGNGYTHQTGEPTAFRPPVYSLFLAGVYYLAGHSLDWVRWIQALLGAGICALVCLTARRLFDDGSAKLAGMLCALYPPLIIPASEILTEVLFMFWLGLTVYWMISQSGSGWRFASGLVLGVALMTRSILVFFLLFLIGWFILVRGRRAYRPRRPSWAACCWWRCRGPSGILAFRRFRSADHRGGPLSCSYVLPPRASATTQAGRPRRSIRSWRMRSAAAGT